jgi:hypothetical protein
MTDMNMHPWLIEQLAASRIEDQQRLAGPRRMAHLTPAAAMTATSTGGISGHLGSLLIRAGQRLAGPDPRTQQAALQLARRRDDPALLSGC